jgi:hypothetical protein
LKKRRQNQRQHCHCLCEEEKAKEIRREKEKNKRFDKTPFSHASIPVVQKESIHLNYGFTLAMQAVHVVEAGRIYEEGQSP